MTSCSVATITAIPNTPFLRITLFCRIYKVLQLTATYKITHSNNNKWLKYKTEAVNLNNVYVSFQIHFFSDDMFCRRALGPPALGSSERLIFRHKSIKVENPSRAGFSPRAAPWARRFSAFIPCRRAAVGFPPKKGSVTPIQSDAFLLF